jgi:threonine dehydrogenase-like Zn-dependent dehydrogenase
VALEAGDLRRLDALVPVNYLAALPDDSKRAGVLIPVTRPNDSVFWLKVPGVLDPNAFVMGERSLNGTLAYGGGPRSDEEFGPVVTMFESGAVDPEPLITSRISLDNVVEDGFEALLNPDREEVKVLVEL